MESSEMKMKQVPTRQDLPIIDKDNVGTFYYVENENKVYYATLEQGYQSIENNNVAANTNIEVSLYNMNQQITEQLGPTKDKNKLVQDINKYQNNFPDTQYFALIGWETHYFTVFTNVECGPIGNIVVECLENVGAIYDGYCNEGNGVYEIWVKQEQNPVKCYVLFPYDQGVIDMSKEVSNNDTNQG